jgi:hypothetical protein
MHIHAGLWQILDRDEAPFGPEEWGVEGAFVAPAQGRVRAAGQSAGYRGP